MQEPTDEMVKAACEAYTSSPSNEAYADGMRAAIFDVLVTDDNDAGIRAIVDRRVPAPPAEIGKEMP